MIVRKGTVKDLESIMQIYAYARTFMAQHGNPRQWAENNWPPRELIENDIKTGCSYVCENDQGEIIGVFYYNVGHRIDPCYDEIEEGNWVGKEDYGVVHRIASNGSQKGIGSFCILWAFEQCGHLRMDTHPDNYVMQNLLTKLGFLKCGVIHVTEDNDPRFAYEKIH